MYISSSPTSLPPRGSELNANRWLLNQIRQGKSTIGLRAWKNDESPISSISVQITKVLISSSVSFIHYFLLTHWHSERPKQAWLFCWYFPHKSIFIKNIWRRNVYQNITNNSPSNILWEFALFPSYFQKYENSSRYFPGELWVWMG